MLTVFKLCSTRTRANRIETVLSFNAWESCLKLLFHQLQRTVSVLEARQTFRESKTLLSSVEGSSHPCVLLGLPVSVSLSLRPSVIDFVARISVIAKTQRVETGNHNLTTHQNSSCSGEICAGPCNLRAFFFPLR